MPCTENNVENIALNCDIFNCCFKLIKEQTDFVCRFFWLSISKNLGKINGVRDRPALFFKAKASNTVADISANFATGLKTTLKVIAHHLILLTLILFARR